MKQFVQLIQARTEENGNNQSTRMRQIFIALTFSLFTALPLVKQIILIY